MDRRRFIASTGLLTAGGATGIAAGWAAEQTLTKERPTARAARPPGPAPYVVAATFRTQPSAKLISPGSIVLLHDGGPQPNASLMKQLDRLTGSLTDDGYRFVTVSELLATSASVSADGTLARNQKSGPESEAAR